MNPIIKLSDNAAQRIKEIMSESSQTLLVLELQLNLVDVLACLMLWNMLKKLILMMKL